MQGRRLDIEEAITLLQGAGYDVFPQAAKLHIRAAQEVGLDIWHLSDKEGYKAAMFKEATIEIARNLAQAGFIERRDVPMGGCPVRVGLRYDFAFYPVSRKEFLRLGVS